MIHRDEMLKQVCTLDFMLLDLGLYLNTNPTDSKALQLYSKISTDLQEIKDKYEKMHGALSSRSPLNTTSESWSWIDNPWPWENEHNYEV